jgi:hypothetical protein
VSPQADETAAADGAPERPVLRVVRGTPDAVELAALVAVVSAASGGGSQPPKPARPSWADPSRSVRSGLPSGGWRTSYAPR